MFFFFFCSWSLCIRNNSGNSSNWSEFLSPKHRSFKDVCHCFVWKLQFSLQISVLILILSWSLIMSAFSWNVFLSYMYTVFLHIWLWMKLKYCQCNHYIKNTNTGGHSSNAYLPMTEWFRVFAVQIIKAGEGWREVQRKVIQCSSNLISDTAPVTHRKCSL